MANRDTCSCGDRRCKCVSPCICCSCLCKNCPACKRQRGCRIQFCLLCYDATYHHASKCGVLCNVTHDDVLLEALLRREGTPFDPVSIFRRFQGDSESNPRGVFPLYVPRQRYENSAEPIDEPMFEIDDIENSSNTSPNKSESKTHAIPGCSKFIPKESVSKRQESQVNENSTAKDKPGCSYVDVNGNFLIPEEAQPINIPLQPSANLNISKNVVSQPTKNSTFKDLQKCSHLNPNETYSKHGESGITKNPSATTSLSNICSYKPSSSAPSHNFLTRKVSLPSRPHLVSTSASSAYFTPENIREVESSMENMSVTQRTVSTTTTSSLPKFEMAKTPHSRETNETGFKSSSSTESHTEDLFPNTSANGQNTEPSSIERASFMNLALSVKSLRDTVSLASNSIEISSPENPESVKCQASSNSSSPSETFIIKPFVKNDMDESSSSDTDRVDN